MDPHTQRAEAERWLGIAAKLLTARDFLGSKTFAMRAREADPNNAVHGQILAVVDTVLAGEKRVNANQQPDWYAVLQLPRLVRDADLIADHYRRLILCLNPERNRFPFADYALQLVMDAWSVLSDPSKKWLFDNELALYLQQSEATSVSVGGSVVVPGGGGGGGDSGAQLNTFQFFQPQPQPQPQPQQMWQQQEFMPLQSQAEQQSQQQQILPPLWQTRDPKGGGGGGGVIRDGGTNTSPIIPTVVSVPQGIPQGNPSQPQVSIARVPPGTTRVGVAGVDGNVSTNVNAPNNNTRMNNNYDNDNLTDDGNPNDDGNVNDVADDEDNVVEEVDCFWTACPYCFYIFEYQKMYQDCTLRCQNCRRGFHAVQIPNPPPISPSKGGGSGGGKGDKGKEKEKGEIFCCWGFYPLGFSMAAWKKRNRIGNSNGSNWVPFAPMFNGPFGGGGEVGGNASDGPKWVYFDDDDEGDDPESSDKDSSDGDWRTLRQEKGKKRKRRRRKVSVGGRKLGRPPKVNVLKPVTTDVPRGGGVSVGGEDMDDGSDAPEVVVGLAAGDKSDARKTASAVLARKLSRRRRAKDMGRLDLNVEFNTDGGDHAPTVSATNGDGDEDGIENIVFFDGLDDFLNTLPILDVNGEEKAKPS